MAYAQQFNMIQRVAMCPYRDYEEAGGLMAYAVDLAKLLRRMADDVHQILSKVIGPLLRH